VGLTDYKILSKYMPRRPDETLEKSVRIVFRLRFKLKSYEE
jgi:hypothetical protein